MSEIKAEMLKPFNEILRENGSSVRLKETDNEGIYHIRLANDLYIDTDNRGVFPNNRFYRELELYFKSIGIERIQYNNTRTAFWAY